MNRRFLIALAGAVVFGLLAIFLAERFVRQRVQLRMSEQETDVVIATADIPMGTQINPQQVAVVKFKRNLIPDGAMLKDKEVVGRISYSDISSKTVILNKQLAGIGAQPGLAGITAEGMRSVSVRVDEASGVAGFIAPGTYVDVIAIMNPQLEGAKAVSKVILQKVRVLAGGQKYENTKDGKAALVNTVTLELSPAQTEKVK
ncbi:MAG: Flp pilus assembly protein CpaB, partial [Chloroflexota bacterium]|nr:Flp pilus assembly protein CpaB [Chloroflexota bacterium]